MKIQAKSLLPAAAAGLMMIATGCGTPALAPAVNGGQPVAPSAQAQAPSASAWADAEADGARA